MEMYPDHSLDCELGVSNSVAAGYEPGASVDQAWSFPTEPPPPSSEARGEPRSLGKAGESGFIKPSVNAVYFDRLIDEIFENEGFCEISKFYFVISPGLIVRWLAGFGLFRPYIAGSYLTYRQRVLRIPFLCFVKQGVQRLCRQLLSQKLRGVVMKTVLGKVALFFGVPK